ncbi:MAG: FtsX-like permease family protein [Ferruginibacter sp.]
MAGINKNIFFETIAGFLQTGNKASRFFSYAGLAVGVMLLLCCVQVYININQLLKEKNPRKNGYDFISVTKTITNENMGKDNRFTNTEVADFKKQPFIADAAPLLSNQFRVKMSAGDIIPFSTDLFLESIQNNFIDTLPPSFTWHPGQTKVPIIFSADFLEMYNVFAPAQGLPQLSASSIGAVNIILECSAPDGTVMKFTGNIVAVSDRLNTVLVPESFLDWGNKMLSTLPEQPAARVYIKTTDANSVALQNYLQQNNYHVNKDKTKFGRIKSTLQAVVAGLGGLAILVVLLSVLLFSFYLQLMISRSKDNLQLLLTLGYSPLWLSKTVSKKWVPVYAIIILITLAATQFFQYFFQRNFITGQDALSPFVDYKVIILSLLLFILCIFSTYRLIKTQLYKL